MEDNFEGNIGFCGINCDSCSVRQFGLGNSKDSFIDCCKKIPQTDLNCGGCKSNSIYAGCRTCALRECAVNRDVSHCGDCSSFPCEQYKKWQSVAKFLPHARVARSNLDEILITNVHEWTKKENIKWRCRKCGTQFSWYSKSCTKCHNDLSEKSIHLNWLKKLFCNFLLPKIYKKGKSIKNKN